MVAPASGDNETISVTLKYDIDQAKKALEDILKSEGELSTKTEKLKQLIIDWSTHTGKSITQTANAFKLLNDEMKKVIDFAAKQAKIEIALSPKATVAGDAIPKIDTTQAKAALDAIVNSESSVVEKTEQLKNLLIRFAIDTGTSIEKASQQFKKFGEVFQGTSTSIVDSAAKVAKAQLLPNLQGATQQLSKDAADKEKQAALDIELARKSAQAVAEARVNAALVAQEAERKRSEEAQKDAELEYKRVKAAAEARVNAALEAQVANEKVAQSIRSIINANISTETKVQQLKNIILNMARESGKSIEQVVIEIKKMDTAFAGTSRTVVDLAGKAAKVQLFPQAAQEATGFASSLSSLGSIGSFVFGSVLGVTAVGVLRNIIQFFTDATDAAVKFNQTLFEFEVGVRAIQRLGLDLTMKEAYAQVDALQKKFPLFSKQELMEGYGQIQLLTRGLHLTKEELNQLLEVAITASTILGRDFGETAAGIARSLSSGWFEMAQKAGLLVDRPSVVREALEMGIESAEHGYNAMTQYERALASLSLYIKENQTLQADTTLIMETQAGKIRVTNAAWADFQRSIGQIFSPLKALGAEALLPIINFMNEMNKAALAGVTQILALSEVVSKFISFSKELRENTVDILSGKIAAPEFNFEDAYKKAWERAAGFTGIEDLLGDIGEEAGLAFGDGLEEGLDANNFADAFEKLGYEIEDELIRMANRMEQLWVDLQRKIADILADEARDIAKANAEYAQSIERENIANAQRVADANAKYRMNEINAEARYHEQLRQLRQRFLFDLEDALRDRDARQVLRLSAQYQMDKTNAKKEFELEQEERARAHQLELAQIAAQHAERLRVLAEEHAAEIESIRERAELQRAEAQLRYEQELKDLKAQTDARLEQKLRDFMREYKLTETQAKNLVKMLDKYFGKNGQVAQMYNNLAAHILAMIKLIQESLGALSGIGTSNVEGPQGGAPGSYRPPVTEGGGHAKGGSFLVTKPTRILVGEGGEAEFVSITPMSKIRQRQEGNMVQATSNIVSTRQASMPSGALQIRLGLSAGLEAQIIDDTLYEVTAIVEEINRVR